MRTAKSFNNRKGIYGFCFLEPSGDASSRLLWASWGHLGAEGSKCPFGFPVWPPLGAALGIL
eukprot:3075-Pyramimonas_sp.AAC.1